MKKWKAKRKTLTIERTKIDFPAEIKLVIETEEILIVLVSYRNYDEGNVFGVGFDGLVKWQIATEKKPFGFGNDVVSALYESEGKIRVCYISGITAYLNVKDGSVETTGERPW